MRKRNYKGRCEKRQIAKCAEVCRTYDDIQRVYAERLSEREDIAEIPIVPRIIRSQTDYLWILFPSVGSFLSRI